MVDQSPVPTPAQPRQIGRAPPPPSPPSRRMPIIIGAIFILIMAGAWWRGRSSSPSLGQTQEPPSSKTATEIPTTSGDDGSNKTAPKVTDYKLEEKYCGTWTMYGVSYDEGKTITKHPTGIPFARVGNGKVRLATALEKPMTIRFASTFGGSPPVTIISFIENTNIRWFLSPSSSRPNDYTLREKTGDVGDTKESYRALISINSEEASPSVHSPTVDRASSDQDKTNVVPEQYLGAYVLTRVKDKDNEVIETPRGAKNQRFCTIKRASVEMANGDVAPVVQAKPSGGGRCDMLVFQNDLIWELTPGDNGEIKIYMLNTKTFKSPGTAWVRRQ